MESASNSRGGKFSFGNEQHYSRDSQKCYTNFHQQFNSNSIIIPVMLWVSIEWLHSTNNEKWLDWSMRAESVMSIIVYDQSKSHTLFKICKLWTCTHIMHYRDSCASIQFNLIINILQFHSQPYNFQMLIAYELQLEWFIEPTSYEYVGKNYNDINNNNNTNFILSERLMARATLH